MTPQRERLSPRGLVCGRMVEPPVLDGTVHDAEWAAATRVDGLVRPDGQAPMSRTSVWFGYDDAYLYVAARCEERNTAGLQMSCGAYVRGLTSREHLELYLDPAHAHTDYCRFYLGPFEQTDNGRGSYRVSFRDGPGSRWYHTREEQVGGMYFRYATALQEGQGWSFELAIPFESLSVEAPVPGTVWGVNFSRFSFWPVFQGNPAGSPPYPSSSHPSERAHLAVLDGGCATNPLGFADLVFGDAGVLLEEADFGIPHFGANVSRFRFQAPPGADLELTSRVLPRRAGRVIDAGQTLSLAPDGEGRVAAEMTWQARPYDDSNLLMLQVRERATGRTVWQARYEFGWESGSLPLHYLHAGEAGPAPDPAPSDPDFLIRKAQAIAARQPRFLRRNTRSGAPSDFTLESADGKVRFDLMDPGCFDAMAAYLRDLYDNDTDRLLGVLFFMAQPSLMRAHCAYDPQASGRLETLSLLRFGSGYCGHMSRVMTVLLNRMVAPGGGPLFRAHNTGIGGHALVMVEYRGSYAILDSKHPVLYYRLDNTDLATMDELRREPEIARRAYPHYMPALMTFRLEHVGADLPEWLEDGSGQVLPEGGATPASFPRGGEQG